MDLLIAKASKDTAELSPAYACGLRRAPPFAIALACTSPSAQAQTFEEAVRHNLAAGVEFCARLMPDVQQTVGALVQAGFQYRAEGDRFETRHLLTAPAETARVTVVAGQTAPECFVESAHLNQSAAAQVVQETIGRLFPGRFQAIGTQTGCARFDETNKPVPLSIYVDDGDDTPACTDTGRTRIGIFSAV